MAAGLKKGFAHLPALLSAPELKNATEELRRVERAVFGPHGPRFVPAANKPIAPVVEAGRGNH